MALGAIMAVAIVAGTPAHAQDRREIGGVSDTSCVGGFTTFNCVTRWGPAGNPYVRPIPGPVDEAERARLVARDRKWLARCSPILERDRYGVGRLHYARPAVNSASARIDAATRDSRVYTARLQAGAIAA
jgi:hypothetical protein